MNTKQKNRINLIDIIIIIVLLASLVAVGFGIYKSLGTSGERVTVRYTVEVDHIDSAFTEKVLVDDGLYDHSTSRLIGTVRAVSSAPAYHTGINAQGEMVSTAIEGKSVLYITAETEAVKTDTGYAVGTTLLGVGRELEVRLPNLFCTAKCVSIEVIEE